MVEEAQTVLEEGIKENPYQVELYHLTSENAFRLTTNSEQRNSC